MYCSSVPSAALRGVVPITRVLNDERRTVGTTLPIAGLVAWGRTRQSSRRSAASPAFGSSHQREDQHEMRGKIHSRHHKSMGVLAGGLVLLVIAAACGSSGGKTTAAAKGTSGSTAAPASSAWQQTIDAAKKEGSVTIYSSQGLDQLNVFAAAFQQKYGIHVDVVRGIDGDLQTKVEAEKQTGHGIADMWVSASQAAVQAKATQGDWFVPATGPDFNAPAYNRTVSYHQGDYFEVGAAILTFGWNTQLYPKGLKDYPDLLDPALKGKIGVIKPTSSSIVDFYLYLEQNYGADFVTKLAAQKPRIYPSSLPMGQALSSGEIS
ncbi:MAG TPA: extracellular solute-binding protein, partial [Acidimicrobiales bacterium]|nr:extracellular solute-binding protein [Acidimicrobiales bacterium]